MDPGVQNILQLAEDICNLKSQQINPDQQSQLLHQKIMDLRKVIIEAPKDDLKIKEDQRALKIFHNTRSVR